VKYLIIKKIIKNSTLAREFIFRSEKWLRDDLYSSVLDHALYELVSVLHPDLLVDVSLKRLGSKNDGGYVFCDLNREYSKLISFGVGDNTDFESELSPLVDFIDLYDFTIDQLPREVLKGTFHKKGLAPIATDGFLTISDAADDVLDDNDLLLKIDIEGGEWDSIDATDERLLRNFSQIFLELHDLHLVHKKEQLEKYIRVLNKLRKNHFLVSVHANNWSPYSVIRGVPLPDTIEITLLRKDLYAGKLDSRISQDNSHLARNNPNVPEYQTIFQSYIVNT